MTQIIKDIGVAVEELLNGEVVVLPTETVYGLSAYALNVDAVLKIFEIKKRPQFNPLIVHVLEMSDIEKYASDIPEEVYKLAEKFSPGPITFVLKKKEVIPDIVTAGLDTVAIRIPSHTLIRKVLKLSSIPVAAPSANIFGSISPTSPEDVLKELEGKVNFILDGGKCEVGIESTVVSFVEEEIKILRPGFITKEEIEEVIGREVSEGDVKNIRSPGLLKFHYAPTTPLYITENIADLKNVENKNTGIMDLSGYGDLRKLAANFFSLLRKFDESGYDYIITQKVEDKDLGIAINDRLGKASKGQVELINGNIKFTKK
jgi:L-threonylcarbamoyladenylate synthase